MPGEPGHCRARTRPLWWASRGVFPSNCPSIAPAEMSNTPRWHFGPLEDNQWGGCLLDPKKSRRVLFQRFYTLGIFWDWVSSYAVTPFFVTLSPGHTNTTRFRSWSSIATGNHLDRAEKIQKVAQTTDTADFLICVQVIRDALGGELPHVQIFMNDEPNPLTWDAQLLSYWFSRNPAIF